MLAQRWPATLRATNRVRRHGSATMCGRASDPGPADRGPCSVPCPCNPPREHRGGRRVPRPVCRPGGGARHSPARSDSHANQQMTSRGTSLMILLEMTFSCLLTGADDGRRPCRMCRMTCRRAQIPCRCARWVDAVPWSSPWTGRPCRPCPPAAAPTAPRSSRFPHHHGSGRGRSHDAGAGRGLATMARPIADVMVSGGSGGSGASGTAERQRRIGRGRPDRHAATCAPGRNTRQRIRPGR